MTDKNLATTEPRLIVPEERKPRDLAPAGSIDNFMELIHVAINKGVSTENLSQLMDIQERLLAKQAEMAFNEAMFKFQSECPTIPFDQTADTGKYKYRYASLKKISETIKPVLAKVGLSYTFRREPMDSGIVRIFCIVRHVLGHSETSYFDIPVSAIGGAMNGVQKLGAADMYGKRYALSGALGIVTGEDDNDSQNLGEPQTNVRQISDKPPYPDEKIKENSPQWKDRFKKKISVPDNLIRQIRSKYILTDEQEKKILALVPKKEEAK